VTRSLQLFVMITWYHLFSFPMFFRFLKVILIISDFILEHRLWFFCLFIQFFSIFVGRFVAVLIWCFLSFHWKFIIFLLHSLTFYCPFKVMRFLINICYQVFLILIAKWCHIHPFFLMFFYFLQISLDFTCQVLKYLRKFFLCCFHDFNSTQWFFRIFLFVFKASTWH